MKVVLLEDIENLGKAGDVVNVDDRYARTELFPRERAAAATGGRTSEAGKDQISTGAEQSEEELLTMQQLAERIDRKTVHIQRPLTPEGTLSEVVTASDIAAALENALRVSLPPDVVRLDAPIDKPGSTPVTLEFPHGLEADVTVVVEGALGTSAAEGKESP